jgi:hypothetical protein
VDQGRQIRRALDPSRHSFDANQVRLQLHVLAYNLGNLLRRLALPPAVKHWTLTTLRDKLVKIGCKVVYHARYVTFQVAEVAVPCRRYRAILDRIRRFAAPPRGRPGMTRHTGEQVDKRGGSSDARLVKSGPKMLTRPRKCSFGNQSAVGGCGTEVVGLADPAAGVPYWYSSRVAARSVCVKWET